MPKRVNNKKKKKQKLDEKDYKSLEWFSTKVELTHNKETNEFFLDVPNLTFDQLPTVSVITITRNRKKTFPLAVNNWINYIYPREKLDWLIIDDEDAEDLTELIPNTPNVKYMRCNPALFSNSDYVKGFDIAKKRNYSIELATGEYICIMDDDDYYPPDSILAKIRILKHYTKPVCYSLPLGVYNTKTKKSHIVETHGGHTGAPEASLCFTKEFWEKGKFGVKIVNGKSSGEAHSFVENRQKDFCNIPFWINMVSITHDANFTENLRDFFTNKEGPDFTRIWDQASKDILEGL